MGIISLVVLGLTLVGMFFGMLFGLIRGRDRALLRLGLIILSAVLAISLRGVLIDAVMNFSIDGSTLKETMLESFGSEGSIPAGLQNLIFALIEILIGFVAYFILLFLCRFLTWFFLFPFLKLIIRKRENKRARRLLAEENAAAVESSADSSEEIAADIVDKITEAVEPEEAETLPVVEDAPKVKLTRKMRKRLVKKHRGMGALVGLFQGILLAYFLLAPLTCLISQVSGIAKMKMNGEPLFELPEEIGIEEYSESALGKIYKATGGWYYRMMTKTTDADGNEISLEATLDSVGVILEVADVATSLEDDLKILGDENATEEEKIATLDTLGDKLISIGTSMEQLDDGIMTMISDLVTEMGGEDVSQEEIDEIMEMLTPEFFEQAGNGVKAFAEYEQIKLDGAELTQDQANDIVGKAHKCITIIEAIEFDVNEGDKDTFKTAIDSIADINAEDKDSLYKVFGIEVTPAP